MNTPYLVGNTYRRDHISGLTLTKAEWLATGSTFPTPAAPISVSLNQLMVCTWQVKRWLLEANGTIVIGNPPIVPNHLEPFSLSKNFIHTHSPPNSDPYIEAVQKTFLIQNIVNLKNVVGPLYLPNWQNPAHYPFFFSSPYPGPFGYFIISETPSTQFGVGNTIFLIGSDDRPDYTVGPFFFFNIPLTIYDPATKLFYPVMQAGVGSGVSNIGSGFPHIGDLTISAFGRMADIVLPLYYGGTPPPTPSTTATLTAVSYW